MVRWCALLGASRPTDNHRGPVPTGGSRPQPVQSGRVGLDRRIGDVGHRDDRGPRASGPHQFPLVEPRHGHPQGGPGGQQSQLSWAPTCKRVIPLFQRAEEGRRGDAVVVDDHRFRPPGQPTGDGRFGGELVHEHVAGRGLRLVVQIVPGEIGGERVGKFGVDGRIGSRRLQPVGAGPGCAPPRRRAGGAWGRTGGRRSPVHPGDQGVNGAPLGGRCQPVGGAGPAEEDRPGLGMEGPAREPGRGPARSAPCPTTPDRWPGRPACPPGRVTRTACSTSLTWPARSSRSTQPGQHHAGQRCRRAVLARWPPTSSKTTDTVGVDRRDGRRPGPPGIAAPGLDSDHGRPER